MPIEDNSKLAIFTKENLLFIRLNAHLLDDAIDQLCLFKDDKASPLLPDDEISQEADPNAACSSKSATITSIMLPSATAVVPPLSTAIITPISTAIVQPLPTAIFTPAGTAFLPPNITIKPITSNNN